MTYSRILTSLIFALGLGVFSGQTAWSTPPLLGVLNGLLVSGSDPIAASTVALEISEGSGLQRHCTGSLIASDLIITAAHCVTGVEPQNIHIFYERKISAFWPNWKPARSFKIHPDYQPKKAIDAPGAQSDLALIRLNKFPPRNYHPAVLLADDAELYQDEEIVIAGYGISELGTPDQQLGSVGKLRRASVILENTDYEKKEMILQQPQGGTCGGDSGGPAFVNRNGALLLVGVASRVRGRDLPHVCEGISTYSKIQAYREFINQAAAALRAGR